MTDRTHAERQERYRRRVARRALGRDVRIRDGRVYFRGVSVSLATCRDVVSARLAWITNHERSTR